MPEENKFPPTRTMIPANAGIILVRKENTLFAKPRMPEGVAKLNPVILPKLNALLLETLSASLRHVWRTHRRICGWALYLDFATGRWHPILPPQLAGADNVTMDLTFRNLPSVEAPGANLRLAGTVKAGVMSDAETLLIDVPPIDGIHVSVYPELDWLAISAHLHIEGRVESVDADCVVHDPAERVGVDLLKARVRLELPITG